MCIYQPQDVNVKCAHAECQVISTIKKLNKNIFVADRKARQQGFLGEDEEVSGFRREEVNYMVEEGYNEARKGLSSKRTVPSMEEIELFDRIIALEKELKDLKEVTMTMKRKLEDHGIL